MAFGGGLEAFLEVFVELFEIGLVDDVDLVAGKYFYLRGGGGAGGFWLLEGLDLLFGEGFDAGEKDATLGTVARGGR